MAHYEVALRKVVPDEVAIFATDFAHFGWLKISKAEYQTLLANPEQEEKVPVLASPETVKGNQTLYPEDPGFSDVGDHHPLSVPSPNDSGTYGTRTLYFKRKDQMENAPALKTLSDQYEALAKREHALREEIITRKSLSSFLFWGWGIFFTFGFLLLMAGVVMSVLSQVVDEMAGLKDTGIVFLVIGGFLFLLGFAIMLISMKKGWNRNVQKAMNAKLVQINQEKVDLFQKAKALQNGPLPFRFEVKTSVD